MKKQLLLPVFSVAAGAAAFVLRLLQVKNGFDAATALPVPGHPAGLALIALFAVSILVLALLSRQLPKEEAAFPAAFSTREAALLTLPVMGILLLLLSGALDAAAILAPDVVPVSGTLSPKLRLIFAATALLPAIALFPAVAACRVHERGETETAERSAQGSTAQTGDLLLIPSVCLVIRLVLVYRLHSVNPSLESYYVQLLALVFLTLGFFRLSSFAFQSGCTRRYALYSGAAVIFSFAALAGGNGLSDLLLYAGGSLTLLGFLLLRLCCRQAQSF